MNEFALTDGTTTVDLNSGNVRVLEGYRPRAATIMDPLRPPSVEETIPLLVSGTSTAAVQAEAAGIDRMLHKARQRAVTGHGPRVFFTARWQGESSTWRSEVLGGALEPAAGQLWRQKTETDLTLSREGFFEDGTERQLAAGANIQNGEAGNSALLGTVEGVLPAPLRVRLTNTSGVGVAWRHIYLANNAFHAPTTFAPFLAGGALSWSQPSTHNLVIKTWALSSAQLAATAGAPFRFLAAFDGTPSRVWWRMNLRYGVTPLAHTDEEFTGTYVAGELYDLGEMRVPPAGYDTAMTGVEAWLSVRDTEAASQAATLDFVCMMPASQGCWRHLDQMGYTVPHNGSMEDNGPENRAYTVAGTGHGPIVATDGLPLHAWPGQQNRIMVLFEEGGSFNASRTMTISAWYRPRRAVI